MKKLKMICRWILISIILQTAAFSYINFIYLTGNARVKATAYEPETGALKGRSMVLPEEALNPKVSFDGLYAAYIIGDELIIADIESEKAIKTINPAKGAVSCYRWLPDREMLIYSIKEPDGKTGQVLISTYDIIPALDRSYPKIKGLPAGSTIINIELSPLTNVVYPIIKTGKKEVEVYKFDIMDNLTYIMSASLSTVFKEAMYTDALIFQTPDGLIRVRNGKTGKTSLLPAKDAKLLLAADGNDYIYTAAANGTGRLIAIFYGTAQQEEEKKENILLEHPLHPGDVYITAGGSIFAADRGQRRIYDLKGSRETEYQGELLTVLDNYVVSLEGNKIAVKLLDIMDD